MNIEDCPKLIFSEHEGYSAYFTKLIYPLAKFEIKISKMRICLSGQHEMTDAFIKRLRKKVDLEPIM